MSGRAKRRWGGGYSSSWIRPETRLAVYLRDGLGCVYCSRDWSQTDGLTCDHVVPRSAGGVNKADNLVTSCRRCNNLRRHSRESPLFGMDEWQTMAAALRVKGDLREHVREHLSLPLDTFRERARSLCADPPKWLRELRELSATPPGDARRLEELREHVPEELQTAQQELTLLEQALLDNPDVPF